MRQTIILIFTIICLLIVTVRTYHDGTAIHNTEITSPSIADAVLLDGRNQTDQSSEDSENDVNAVFDKLEANNDNGEDQGQEEVQMETESEQNDEIEIIEEVSFDEPEEPSIQ